MNVEETSKEAPEQEPKSSDSDYFQRWYEKNGRTLNKERKKKYHSDPSYREKVLEQNRAARAKKRDEVRAARKSAGGSERTLVTKSWKTRPMELTLESGEEVVVQGFTIGAVAAILGCSVQAIRLWERKEILPATNFRYQGRDRLYPWELIDEYQEILLRTGRLDPLKAKPRPLWMTKQIVKFSNGTTAETPLFRIGVLAKAAKKTVVTLEQWEARGLLPATPFRHISPNKVNGEPGYRLFTLPQIRAVVNALKSRVWEVRGEQAQKEFHDEVLAAWEVQGVVGARIVKLQNNPDTSGAPPAPAA